MTRRMGSWIAVGLAIALATGARAELPEDGVANGRFAEVVGFDGGGLVSAAMHDEPDQAGVVVSVYVNDSTTGYWAYGEGVVPKPLASITADRASASFDLAEVPGFQVTGCGYVDGAFTCGAMAAGRVELTLERTGEVSRENGSSRQDLPDGSARRVTRAGWTAGAAAAGNLLGFGIPADASAKIGSYHLLVVSKVPAK